MARCVLVFRERQRWRILLVRRRQSENQEIRTKESCLVKWGSLWCGSASYSQYADVVVIFVFPMIGSLPKESSVFVNYFIFPIMSL